MSKIWSASTTESSETLQKGGWGWNSIRVCIRTSHILGSQILSYSPSYPSICLLIRHYSGTFQELSSSPLQLSGPQTPDHSQNPILPRTQQTAHLLGAQILRSHLYIHLRSHYQLQPRGYATGSTATSLYQFQWLSSDRYSHFDAVPCHTKVVWEYQR